MKTVSRRSAGTKAACAAFLLSSALLAMSSIDAAALPSKTSKADPRAKVAEAASVKDPETTSSIDEAHPVQPGCQRPRKRLWVEGEGWIVRRVTVCY